jgi:hypothetical protein
MNVQIYILRGGYMTFLHQTCSVGYVQMTSVALFTCIGASMALCWRRNNFQGVKETFLYKWQQNNFHHMHQFKF